MTKMSSVSPVGTLAYVVEEEALLVRVNNGWQYIAVSFHNDPLHKSFANFLPILRIIYIFPLSICKFHVIIFIMV